jgi:hypothetical protein
MQYLMVLLLSAFVFVAMMGVVLAVSYGLGVLMHSRTGGRSAEPGNTDPCAQCHADRDWYEELPIWKRNLVTAWWLANRYRCVSKDCG